MTTPPRVIVSNGEQRMLDALVELQVCRTESAVALVRDGDHPSASIVAHGADINDQMMSAARSWRQLLSIRRAGRVESLRASLPNNRACLEDGLQMRSIFDRDSTPAASRLLLSGESKGSYAYSTSPLQLKIVNQQIVYLEGPQIDGHDSVMALTSPRALNAARRYWRAVEANAVGAVCDESFAEKLTVRQRQVVALMSCDTPDESIANALDVSVRTVRADIAGVLRALGCQSRFTAGVRLRSLLA